jgi:polysaccharide transporter, PST family
MFARVSTRWRLMNREERGRRILNTDHLNEDLGRHAARGGIIAVAAQPIRMVMQFVFTAILARLLAPEAFGIIAMATAVTSFVALFSELGLTSATIQRSHVDQNLVSGLFFVGLGISLVLMPLIWVLAPLAVWFFHDPRVANPVIVLSVSFPLAALGAQHTALLLRSMRWMTLQWTGLAGHAAGGLAGVLIAWKTDLSYWALVITALVAQIVTLSLIWGLCPWRPSLVTNWRDVRSGLRFGAYLTGFGIVNFFHRQLDNIIVGLRFGATELGYYSRGYQMMLLPLNIFSGPLSSAIEPSLSRLQDQPERWRRAFLDALGLVVFLGAGVAAGLIAVADPLVTTIYGVGWEKAATIFQWLAVSLFAGVPMHASSWIYMSLGQTRRMFIWSLFFVPVVGLGFVLAIPYGSVGIAISYAITMNLLLVPCFAFASRGTPVSLLDTLAVILPFAGCGVIAALAGLWVSTHEQGVLLRLILGATTAGLSYLLLATVLITKATIYRQLRDRVGILSRGLAAEVRGKMMPHFERWIGEKK